MLFVLCIFLSTLLFFYGVHVAQIRRNRFRHALLHYICPSGRQQPMPAPWLYILLTVPDHATPSITADVSPSSPPGPPAVILPRDLPTTSSEQDTTVWNTAAFNYVCLADRTFSNHAQNLKVERKIPLFVSCVKAVVLFRKREKKKNVRNCYELAISSIFRSRRSQKQSKTTCCNCIVFLSFVFNITQLMFDQFFSVHFEKKLTLYLSFRPRIQTAKPAECKLQHHKLQTANPAECKLQNLQNATCKTHRMQTAIPAGC